MTTQETCTNAGRKYGMNSFQKNWFTEIGNLDKNFAWSIRVNKTLHQEKTAHEDILIFESERFGRCLALDDYIPWTENDGFVYEEMAAFLSLNCHINPKKVLVIGGVYGGVVREATKHPLVHSIVICEPDEEIIKVCKKFLPLVAEGYQSPKLTVNIEDPEQYLKRCKEEFDIIVADLSEPAESASAIFEKSCFKCLKDALKPGGIFVSQVESFWFDVQRSRKCLDICTTMFPVVDYATTFAPSVPSGQRGILLCAKSTNTDFRKPIHKFSDKDLKNYKLKYYTPDVHRAAFALPYSIHKDLGVKLELDLK